MAKIEEIWKDVTGWEGLYQVSNHGRVKSMERKMLDRRGGLKHYKSRVRKINVVVKKKYKCLTVNLAISGRYKTEIVSRLVAKHFIPNPLNKEQVNHIDGDSTNNYVGNIEWATRKENAEHSSKNGLVAFGERTGGVKLSDNQVIQIRKSKLSRRRLAERFSVSQTCVRAVIKRITWKHI